MGLVDLLISPKQLEEELEAAELATGGALLTEYWDDPVGFARDICGIDPWDRQADILRAAAIYEDVSVKSGHKVGKSLSAAILALWWVATRPRARAILTAPSAPQIKTIIWAELETLWPKVRQALGGPRRFPLDPKTGLRLPGGRRILGIATDKPERLAGQSGEHLLFIIDEASGFRDDLYEAIQGNQSGGATIVAFSNPTRTSGWFYENFAKKRGHLITVSSEDSPNVKAKEKVVPGLFIYPHMLKLRRELGPGYRKHPFYMVRVLGEFPASGPKSVFGFEAVSSASERWAETDDGVYGQLSIGVDPSRYGDDPTVIQGVRGHYAYLPKAIPGKVDGPRIATDVVAMVRALRRPTDGPVPVFVDGVAVGAAAVDSLRLHPAHRAGEFYVVGLALAGPASDPSRYQSLRSEIWFLAEKWLVAGGALPPVPDLTQEMTVAEYDFDSKNRQFVYSKKHMRKKLQRSPNHADALCYAVLEPPEMNIADALETAQQWGHDDEFDDRWGLAG